MIIHPRHNQSLTQIADQYGAVCADIRGLELRREALKTAMIAQVGDAQDAGAAVEAVASSIVSRGAKTHEDLVCLAEIARFDARLDFAGPPALDLDDPGDKVLLALMNSVVRLLPGEGAH